MSFPCEKKKCCWKQCSICVSSCCWSQCVEIIQLMARGTALTYLVPSQSYFLGYHNCRKRAKPQPGPISLTLRETESCKSLGFSMGVFLWKQKEVLLFLSKSRNIQDDVFPLADKEVSGVVCKHSAGSALAFYED